MDHQFCVDVPRIVFFVDSEWIPSSEPNEVWERLIEEYDGDILVVKNAAECFKQQFLSDYYIDELHDINFDCDDTENLISHNRYRVTINSKTGYLTIEKDFVHSLVVEGDFYNIDYCILTVVFDPYLNKEVNHKWTYTIDSMRSGSRSLILDKSFNDI